MRFLSYWGEMKRLFRDGGAVKVGRALKELSLKATKATADFTAKGRQEFPQYKELAEILSWRPAAAAQAVGAAQRPISQVMMRKVGDRLMLRWKQRTKKLQSCCHFNKWSEH